MSAQILTFSACDPEVAEMIDDSFCHDLSAFLMNIRNLRGLSLASIRMLWAWRDEAIKAK